MSKVKVERVYLDRQGYADRGRGLYYGTGEPVYKIWVDDYDRIPDAPDAIRARDRAAAVKKAEELLARAKRRGLWPKRERGFSGARRGARRRLGAAEESHLGAYLLAGGIGAVFIGGIYMMIKYPGGA